jgi:hypothetical protein
MNSNDVPTMKYEGKSKRVVKHVHQFKTEETVDMNDEKPQFVDDKDYFTNNINQQNISRILRKCADEIDRLNKTSGYNDGYVKTEDGIEVETNTNFRGINKNSKKTIGMLAKDNEQYYDFK